MTLLQLFFVFAYIGLFAVGGGLVAASFMQDALVNRWDLISAEKFYSMLAISESTPGPIGINIATYIGTELFGIPGAIVATAGEVLPSIVVIILIAKWFSRVGDNPLVKTVFKTLRPVTTALIFSVFTQVFSLAVLSLDRFRSSPAIWTLFNWNALAVFAISLVVLLKTKLHPVFIVLFGALSGVLFF